MIKKREYYEDEKAAFLDHQGQVPVQGPLTDFTESLRLEQLEERVIYVARLRPGEAFNIGLNPPVATASELLSEMVRLKHSTVLEDLTALKERLTSVMRSFGSRTVQGGVEDSQVMAARYVLCTVVDGAIVTTPWGNESE